MQASFNPELKLIKKKMMMIIVKVTINQQMMKVINLVFVALLVSDMNVYAKQQIIIIINLEFALIEILMHLQQAVIEFCSNQIYSSDLAIIIITEQGLIKKKMMTMNQIMKLNDPTFEAVVLEDSIHQHSPILECRLAAQFPIPDFLCPFLQINSHLGPISGTFRSPPFGYSAFSRLACVSDVTAAITSISIFTAISSNSNSNPNFRYSIQQLKLSASSTATEKQSSTEKFNYWLQTGNQRLLQQRRSSSSLRVQKRSLWVLMGIISSDMMEMEVLIAVIIESFIIVMSFVIIKSFIIMGWITVEQMKLMMIIIENLEVGVVLNSQFVVLVVLMCFEFLSVMKKVALIHLVQNFMKVIIIVIAIVYLFIIIMHLILFNMANFITIIIQQIMMQYSQLLKSK